MNDAVAMPRLPDATRKALSPWEFWGRVLVVPYLLVFLIFVVLAIQI